MVLIRVNPLLNCSWNNLSGGGGHWPTAANIMPTLHDLHLAIKLNQHAQVAALLIEGKLNVNSSLLSCTALSLAIYRADERIVRYILVAGADPDKLSCDTTDRFEAPLLAACRLGKSSIAKLLIHYGANVNCVDIYQHTPLWIAVRERNALLAQTLIEAGALISIGDKWAQCPLYLAVKYYGREGIARLLILHGCRLDCTDTNGNSILYWTIINGQFDLTRLLIKAGCHVENRIKQMILQPVKASTAKSNNNNTELLKMPQLLRDNPVERHDLRSLMTTVSPLTKLCSIKVRRLLTESRYNRGQSIWPLVDKLRVPAVYKLSLKTLVEMPNHYV